MSRQPSPTERLQDLIGQAQRSGIQLSARDLLEARNWMHQLSTTDPRATVAIQPPRWVSELRNSRISAPVPDISPAPGPGIGRQPYGNDNIMGSVRQPFSPPPGWTPPPELTTYIGPDGRRTSTPPSPVTPSRTDFRPPPIRTELPPRPTEYGPRNRVNPFPDRPTGPAPVPNAGPKPSSEPWWKSNIRRRTQGTLRSSATAPRRYDGGGQVMANGRFPLPSAAQIGAMSPEQKMQQGPQLLSNIRMGLRPSSYYNMPGSVREGMSGIVSALGMPPDDFYQGLEQGYPQGVNPAQGITAGFSQGGQVRAGNKVKFKRNADGSTEFSSD